MKYSNLVLIILFSISNLLFSDSNKLNSQLFKVYIEKQDSLSTPELKIIDKLLHKFTIEEQVDKLYFLADSLKDSHPQLSKSIMETAYLKSKDVKSLVNKANFLDNLSMLYYSSGEFESAKKSAIELINLVDKSDEEAVKRSIISGYNILGMIEEDFKHDDLALKYYFQGLNRAEEIGVLKLEASILGNIGILYLNTAEYEKSLKFLTKSLQIKKETNNHYAIPPSLLSIGNIYFYLNDYQKAILNYEEALSVCRGIKREDMYAEIFSGLGMTYLKTEEYQKAYDNYKIALRYDTKMKNTYYIAYSSNSVGISAMFLKDYSGAKKYFKIALKNSIVSKDTSNILMSQTNILKLGLIINDYKELTNMISFLEKNLIKLDPYNKIQSYMTLGEYYLLKNNYTKGHNYLLESFEIKDNIFSEKLAKESVKLVKKLETVNSYSHQGNFIRDMAFSNIQELFFNYKKTVFLISIFLILGMIGVVLFVKKRSSISK